MTFPFISCFFHCFNPSPPTLPFLLHSVKIEFRAPSLGKSKPLPAFPLRHQQFPQIEDFPPSSTTFLLFLRFFFVVVFLFFFFFALGRNWEIQGESGLERKGVGGRKMEKKIHLRSSHGILPCSGFSFELDAPPLPLMRNKFPGLDGKVWMQRFSDRSLSVHTPELFYFALPTPFFPLFYIFFSIIFSLFSPSFLYSSPSFFSLFPPVF